VSKDGSTVSHITYRHESAMETYHDGGGTTLVIGNRFIPVQIGIAFDVGLMTGLFEFVWRQDGPIGGIVQGRGTTTIVIVVVVVVVIVVVVVVVVVIVVVVVVVITRCDGGSCQGVL